MRLASVFDVEAMRPCGVVLIWFACAVVVGLAVAAESDQSGFEFSVRLEGGAARPSGARVRLYPACSSADCGRSWLDGDWPEPRWSGAFEGVGRFRPFDGRTTSGGGLSEVDALPAPVAPPAREDWWVVVDRGAGAEMPLPVAWLWRPGTGADDLSPAPLVPGRSCTAIVLSRDTGAPVPGAVVVPEQRRILMPPNQARSHRVVTAWTKKAETWSGGGAWYAFLPPVVAGADGRAVLWAPADGETTVHVRAEGFVAAEVTCRPAVERSAAGTSFTVRLGRVTGSLEQQPARPEGVPLASLPTVSEARESRPIRGSGSALKPADAGYLLGLGDVEEVEFWLDGPALPWSGARVDRPPRPPTGTANRQADRRPDRRVAGLPPGAPGAVAESGDLAAAPAERSDTAPGLDLQLGESIWFAAPGHGHDLCSGSELKTGACPVLAPAMAIRGRVVDDRGSPLAGVEIHLARDPTRPGGPVHRHFLRTRSDGVFATDRLPGPERLRAFVRVAIRHPGFLPVDSVGMSGWRTEEGEYLITLQPGVVVTGTVVDADTGHAVAGAEVGLGEFSAKGFVASLNSLAALRLGKTWTARTGDDGRFAVRAPPGRHDLAVRPAEHAFRLMRGVEAPPVESHDVGVIALDGGLVFLGRVVDETSAGIPGAHVSVAAQRTPDALGRDPMVSWGDALRLRTDADGSFRVPGLPSWVQLDVWAAADGFVARTLRGLKPTPEPIEIRLGPGAVLHGRLSHGGKPARGSFELFGSANRGFRDPLTGDPGFVTSGRVGNDGSFRVEGLEADRYRIVVSSRGGEEKRAVVELEAGEERRLDLEFDDRPGRIAGRVMDRRAGLAGVTVRLLPAATGDGEGRAPVSATTGSDGRFVFENVPVGWAALEFDSGDGTAVHDKALQVRPGANRVTVDFGVYEIRGRVVLPRGGDRVDDPVAFGGRLTFLSLDWPDERPAAAVDARGNFRVHLRRGDHDVGGSLEGVRVVSVDKIRVRGDEAGVRLRLRSVGRGRIVGRIHGLADDELQTLRVEAVDRELNIRPATLDGDGDFIVERLAAGNWTLVGEVGSSHRRATRSVKVGPGEARVDLVFERGHELAGVVRLDGVPWAGAQVLVMPRGKREQARRAFTGHDGAFAFLDLESGRYLLAAGADVRELDLHGDQRLDLQLESGAVRGLILSQATGLPAPGTVVSLWPAAASRREADAIGATRTSWTADTCEFVFQAVPSGDWVLEVAGRPGSRQRLSVAPGRDTVIAVPGD